MKTILNIFCSLLLILGLTFSLVACSSDDEVPQRTDEEKKDDDKTDGGETDDIIGGEVGVGGGLEDGPDDTGNTGNTGSTDTDDKGDNTDGEDNTDEKKPLSYEEYLAMDADGQEAFYMSFENPVDFYAWHTQAKAEYDALHSGDDIGNGDVNIGDIVGGNS